MVVALRAAERRPQPYGRGVAHAVGEVDGPVLLGLGPALLGGLQEPVVAGGDPLLRRGIRQEVARELHGRELVEGQVAVEGADHVVAIAPHRARVVAVVAGAVGIAHEVEPIGGHALAEAL